jgi:hypothetical protein
VKLESWKRAERRQVRAELRQLAKEERQRQQKALQVWHMWAGVKCWLCILQEVDGVLLHETSIISLKLLKLLTLQALQ